MSGTSVLLKAIVQVTGKPVEAIKAYLADKTQAQKMALRDSAEVPRGCSHDQKPRRRENKKPVDITEGTGGNRRDLSIHSLGQGRTAEEVNSIPS